MAGSKGTQRQSASPSTHQAPKGAAQPPGAPPSLHKAVECSRWNLQLQLQEL